MSAYTSSKQFELGSTAFRQWKADHSHCKFIHGYQLKTELTFGCHSLDDKNWCVDFGGLDTLKQTLRNTFDHTVVVAGDDPALEAFQLLEQKGIIQLRVLDNGVGVEKFAEFVFKTADAFVDEASEGRCFVVKAKVTEHADNAAEYTRETDSVAEDHECCQAKGEKEEVVKESSPEPVEEPTKRPPESYGGAARVGPDVKQGNFGDPFAGTTWGN
jgi:6-pyruvoyltetrahydropterin/6-carboxytetrahydropterin synthase|tara:strand:+ start:1821 stop:2465 length:645 start_codon:yes stop_codon:yes gene_type:complete